MSSIADSSGGRAHGLSVQNRTDLPDTLITTFTGTERRGLDRFGGDGGPATQAQLNAPSGVTVDGAGNVYIADTWNHRIRRVDPWGYISTDAGSGSFGDYGPATQALFHLPGDVALDDVGNVYIADTWNHRIRRVDPSGGRIITTIAGTGGRGFFGHGASAIIAWLNTPYGVVVDGAGNVYIADSGNHRIRRVDPSGIITTIAGSGERGLDRFGGDGGPAVQARLNNPRGVAVDGAGNVYIADTFNHRIRKVDSSGVITTIAGSGEEGFSGDGSPATQAQLYYPSGVALDGAGNLYIADTANHRIRKMDSSGVITTIAGTGERGFGGDGGPATAARLNNPRGVAVDGAGNVYIAAFNHRIRKVDSSGVITTIAGSGERGFSGDGGPAVQARLNAPRNVTADAAGNLYIADQSNNRIRVLKTNPLQTGPTTPPAGPQPAADGTITTIAGTGEEGFGGDGGPAVQARLSFPTGVAVDDAGNVYIAVQSSHRIRKVDSTGTITTVAGDGMEGFGGDGGPAAQAQLTNPRGVAVDGAGNLYIADTGNHRIRKVDATGTITTIAGTTEERVCDPRCRDRGPAVMARLNFPLGVAVDGAGNLYIADSDNHRVRKVDSTGTIATIAGDGTEGFSGDGDTATAAQLSYPAGVAVDGAGNVYISDTTTDRIRRVDSTGTITTIAGDGTEGFGGDGGAATAAQLNFPVGVAVDDAGNLYIADYYNHRVRKVDSTGTITTIAGTGDHGYGGDGGPAAQARLTAPSDVAADNAGNLYIADQGNNRIRVVKTNPCRQEIRSITSLILPWERVGKPRSPISTIPRRR